MDLLALRVAARFSRYAAVKTRPMKPEKLQALLIKLRKNTDLAISMGQFMQVLEALGFTFGTKLMTAFGSSKEDVADNILRWTLKPNDWIALQHLHARTQKEAEEEWADIKRTKGHTTPPATGLRDGEQIFTHMSEVKELSGGSFAFSAHSWIGVTALTVRAPSGKTCEILKPVEDLPQISLGHIQTSEGERFTKWAESAGLKQLIADRLEMPTYEVEKADAIERARKYKRTKDNLATCPCCFGDYKMVPRTLEGKDKTMPGMVLHGYKRPGHGWINGECFGRHWPPFEISPEGTIALQKHLERFVPEHIKRVNGLKSDKATVFHFDPPKPSMVKAETPPHEWEKELKSRLSAAERDLENLKSDIAQLDRKIKSWKFEPIPAFPGPA